MSCDQSNLDKKSTDPFLLVFLLRFIFLFSVFNQVASFLFRMELFRAAQAILKDFEDIEKFSG